MKSIVILALVVAFTHTAYAQHMTREDSTYAVLCLPISYQSQPEMKTFAYETMSSFKKEYLLQKEQYDREMKEIDSIAKHYSHSWVGDALQYGAGGGSLGYKTRPSAPRDYRSTYILHLRALFLPPREESVEEKIRKEVRRQMLFQRGN